MNLQTQLLEISKASSFFETNRDYISLSNIFKPIEQLIRDYKNGYTADEQALLKCRLGYWMERGLKERLLLIDGISEGIEVEYPNSNGLIKGHTDFVFNSLPGDCKSFALDSYMPLPYKIPQKIYWQMNAYMLCMGAANSVIVCESRESGKIEVIEIKRNDSICNSIDQKCKSIINLFE